MNLISRLMKIIADCPLPVSRGRIILVGVFLHRTDQMVGK
jgi:hypothetical protein